MRAFTTLLLALACGCLLSAGSASAGAAKKVNAGTSTAFSWSTMGINAARKAEKPILLYVWDSSKKSNAEASGIETYVFEDKDVKSTFGSFSAIRLTTSSKGWPPQLLAAARNGAAIYVMTADGSIVAQYTSKPTTKAFVVAGQRAAAANAAAVEAMKKNPPPEYKDPEVAQPAGPAGGPPEAEPEEKKSQKLNTIPGLEAADKSEKTGKEAGEKSGPPPEKPKNDGGGLVIED